MNKFSEIKFSVGCLVCMIKVMTPSGHLSNIDEIEVIPCLEKSWITSMPYGWPCIDGKICNGNFITGPYLNEQHGSDSEVLWFERKLDWHQVQL